MSLLVNSKDVTLKLLNFFNTTKSNIYIKKGMVKNYTTEMIKNNIEMCILKGYRPPDIVIVDYLDLILDTDYKSEERIKLQNISNSLKSLSQELDVVVVTATQLNRESYKKNARVDLNNIAESSGKSHVSDSVLILNSTPEEFNNGILYMYIAKNRHGKSMKTIKFNVDFDCMIFTDSGEFIDGNIDLSNNYMVDLEELEI
jgi:replicative DNA helicase